MCSDESLKLANRSCLFRSWHPAKPAKQPMQLLAALASGLQECYTLQSRAWHMSVLCQVQCHKLFSCKRSCSTANSRRSCTYLVLKSMVDLLRTGFRTVLAVHGVVICYYLGPTRTASLTLRCALACAGYKFCETLVKSAPSGVRSRLRRSLRVPLLRLWMLRSVAPKMQVVAA